MLYKVRTVIKALDRVCSFLAVLSGLIIIFVTLSIGYSILSRATGLPGAVWVVQFNEYALLWMTFLGTAWFLSRKKHISVHIILQRLSEKNKKRVAIVHALMGMVLCGLFCWFTAFTTIEKIGRNVIDVQAVDIPIGYVLIVIPLGFLLLFLQFIRNLVEAVRATRIDLGETGTL
jgi:TRAP-type C4-dicarboxylate transport system permease small subunit